MKIEAKWSDFRQLDAGQALSAINRTLPRWVALLLVIGITWQLAQIIWMLIPGSDTSHQIIAPSVQISRTTATSGESVDVQKIAGTHLFGEANSEEIVATLRQEDISDIQHLAETQLNLSLKGTLASEGSRASIAIIADAGNEEKIYIINDRVTPVATLHAVYTDRVVLNRSGALEVLKLPKELPQGAVPVRRNSTTVSRSASSNRTQSIQNIITQNATRLADVIRPTPYYVSGQMQGYRVYPGRDRKQFAALGLRPGDLIKDVDGATLTNPQQATQVFQGLADKEQVSVTVERNGQRETLILRTSQLELDNSL